MNELKHYPNRWYSDPNCKCGDQRVEHFATEDLKSQHCLRCQCRQYEPPPTTRYPD